MVIPKILFRTVPESTTYEVEAFWDKAQELHPDWAFVTYRDPVDDSLFPLTSPHWDRCQNGAQRAGLIRFEGLYNHGGVYIDSDVEPYRQLDGLLGCYAFAGYEDASCIPDAVLGSEPGTDLMKLCIEKAIGCLHEGAWHSGPGVITNTFPLYKNALLLPPGSFYPYHYTEKERRHEDFHAQYPWAFGAHHWAGSWL